MAGPRKPRRPTGEELDLFGQVVHDAAPIRSDRHADHAVEPEPIPPTPQAVAPAKQPTTQSSPPSPPPTQPPQPPAKVPLALDDHSPGGAPGVDRRLQVRLKRGQIPIEARIDLHGLSRERAHVALNGFLARQEALGRRCVLVITGKGRPDWAQPGGAQPDWGNDMREIGVIRRALPGWLADHPNRERVLAFAPAQLRDGGKGAWYVLLRRRKGGRSPGGESTP